MFVPNYLLLYLQIFLLSDVPYYYIPSNFLPSYPTYLHTNYLCEYQSTFLEDNLLTFLGPLFFTIDYFFMFLLSYFPAFYFPTSLLFYLPSFLLSYFPTCLLSKMFLKFKSVQKNLIFTTP